MIELIGLYLIIYCILGFFKLLIHPHQQPHTWYIHTSDFLKAINKHGYDEQIVNYIYQDISW